jgi:ELWxxDGT repeat protein
MPMPMPMLLFSGYDADGNDGLWVSDGTAAGTHELTGISGAYGGGNGVSPYNITAFDGGALFAGEDASGVVGLWVTDGTIAGTHEVTSINGVYSTSLFPNGVYPGFAVLNGGKVLFSGFSTGGLDELWVSDGTADGTHALNISGESAHGLTPVGMTLFNNEVLFTGTDGVGMRGLWVSDGTALGTHELTGINNVENNGGPFSGSLPAGPDFTVFNSKVLFVGNDTQNSPAIWITDGTAAGTHELTENVFIYPNLTVFNGKVLFEGGGSVGLYVTDGTLNGTHELTGVNDHDPRGLFYPLGGNIHADFTPFNGEVLFEGRNTSGFSGLWGHGWDGRRNA